MYSKPKKYTQPVINVNSVQINQNIGCLDIIINLT